jgi:PPIC-type PPIASE domain
MIVVQGGNSGHLQKIWNDARVGPKEFLKVASEQFIPNLAQKQGEVPPIHKHFGDKTLEDTAFRLKKNEVSDPIKMPDGMYVILYCEDHIAKNVNVRYEHERLAILKEVKDMKIAQKIPEVFAKLHKDANPRLLLQNAVHHLARSEMPARDGLSAFDHVPSGELQPPPPSSLPEPKAGKVLAPEGHGIVPNIPQVAPPMPIGGVSPLGTLPKIEPPVESKN